MNTTPLEPATPRCHSCGQPVARLAPGYEGFHRVTSDCKPWPPGGQLGLCGHCGLVQTLRTRAWEEEARLIYQNYTIYHQSGGAEQQVFDGFTGAGAPRSKRIIEALLQSVSLPRRGRLWDVGCGNGAFLAAWSHQVPGWSLCGSEVGDQYRSRVEAIPGVERLYTHPTEVVPGTFDVISMIHVFEHIPAPVAHLTSLRERLRPGGLLVIEVPDCEQNPFMLVVADHASHFSPALLAGVVAMGGFEVLEVGSAWVPKEVSLVARKPADRPNSPTAFDLQTVRAAAERVFAGWQELARLRTEVRAWASRPAFGLLGTAIAATWLDTETGQAARFFVEEDPNRVGKHHLGRPILAPSDAPSGATVFVALPSTLAGTVAARLRARNPTLQVILPP